MPRWRWVLTHVTRRLWFRATLIGLLGVAAAMLATVAENYIPWDLPWNIGADAVDSILAIIASSMLAVTTFSLNVMTSAYGSAANNVTPRATRLLREDPVTQNVLSTFIGSFLFSIVGIVVLKTGAYGARGRVVLFIVTIGVIALIVISLLRWIDYLTHFGQVGETTKRVEDATREAIEARLKAPSLGGAPLLDPANEIPKAAAAVAAEAIGYVEHIDMSALSRWCDEADAKLYLAINPGAFVYADTTLAWFKAKAGGGSDKEMTAAVRKAFSIGETRSFDQDPRFGLAVMSEIASRALSPAMNDPGTAIDVIGRTHAAHGSLGEGLRAGGAARGNPLSARACAAPDGAGPVRGRLHADRARRRGDGRGPAAHPEGARRARSHGGRSVSRRSPLSGQSRARPRRGRSHSRRRQDAAPRGDARPRSRGPARERSHSANATARLLQRPGRRSGPSRRGPDHGLQSWTNPILPSAPFFQTYQT